MSIKKENSHKNHRNRLKEKVKKFGLECLEYHEILELLLTYTIPRKDTNALAHDLINHFNSFSNVIDSNYHDLIKVDGVGPESALFLNVLAQFLEVYNKSKLESKIFTLNNTEQAVAFFRESYRIKGNEFMVVACLSKTNRVIKTYLCKGKDETEVTFDLNQIINSINDTGVDSVVLFHTHPNGNVLPSKHDISTTQSFLNMCLIHGINFNDHIILNEGEHYSFKKLGIIDKMKEKYRSTMSTEDIYITTLISEMKKNKKD